MEDVKEPASIFAMGPFPLGIFVDGRSRSVVWSVWTMLRPFAMGKLPQIVFLMDHTCSAP